MAGEADLGGRDAGERRFLNRPVAIAAVDAVVADVVLVAERDRLLRRERAAVRGQRLVERHPDQGDDEHGGEEGELEREDGGWAEDLRHQSSFATCAYESRPKRTVPPTMLPASTGPVKSASMAPMPSSPFTTRRNDSTLPATMCAEPLAPIR